MKSYYRLMNEVTTEGTDSGGATTPPTEAAAVTPTAATAKTMSWDEVKSYLPEDLRNDSALSTTTSLEGLAKMAVHAQKAIGNRVPIPDKHATPDDWSTFFRKVGNPEKIEDYKVNFKTPEGHQVNEEFISSIKEVAHKSGILPQQFEAVINAYLEKEASSLKGYNEQQQSKTLEGMTSLKKEWGDAFEGNVKKANVALKELLPENDLASLQGWENNPALTKLLANASKFFKEDVFVGHGEGKLAGVSPGDALQRARDIQGDKSHPYRNPSHPNYKQAQKEVADLYEIAYPG